MLTSVQTDVYINAVLLGITNDLFKILSPDIEAVSPTSPIVLTDKATIITGLGLVCKIVSDLKLVRFYQADDNWHLGVFRGNVNGEAIMFTDQLHINGSGMIDRLEISLWPTTVAGAFPTAMSGLLKQLSTSPNLDNI